jgi:hypothetical protein
MNLPFPGLGILFDIDALGGGNYGYRAWKIFMNNIHSEDLSSCVLVEGDALRNLAGSDNLFCIGIYGFGDLRNIRERFEGLDVPGLAPMPGRVIDKPVLDLLPLPTHGNVDAFGRLVTKHWNRMDHDLCKEAGWGYDPEEVPVNLDEHLLKELKYMRVDWPMEQIHRVPEKNARQELTPLTPISPVAAPRISKWQAIVRRLFPRRYL